MTNESTNSISIRAMSLRYKVALGAVLISAIPLVLAGILSLRTARQVGEEELSQLAQDRMVAMRDSKRGEVEDYFNTIQNQLRTLSNDHMVIDAMRELTAAYESYPQEIKADPQIVETKRDAVAEYYERDFAEQYQQRNAGERAPVTRLLSELSDRAVLLQSAYIHENPHPLGSKNELNFASDGTSYSRFHRRLHPKLRDFLEKFGYYDIFLVDDEKGDVVYSVFKELDFATSLKDGAYAESALGRVYREALTLGTSDAVAMTDFSPYLPSYQDQAAFGASPIFDGNERIGVLIFQMPVDRINEMMVYGKEWETRGLGKSGETYLVGPDKTLRSPSRFLIEDKDGYLAALKAADVNVRILNLIDSKNTSTGLQPVESVGLQQAADGDSGVSVYEDYRGTMVLGAYSPLEIAGLDWVILSEIDYEEAMATNATLGRALLRSTLLLTGLLILVAAAVGLYVARKITNPVLALQRVIEEMERDSDLSRRAEVSSSDEIGAAANAFNQLAARMQKTIADITNVTGALARGDLTVALKEEYRGDFTSIQTGFSEALRGLNNVLAETTDVVHEVNQSAAQLKDASQAVASAAHEQSSAAHESLSALDETASMADANASNAESVTKLVASAAHAADDSKHQMEQMMTSMAAIDESSKKIVKIIGVIDEIAFQTNLLSLNATVEAARAGKHGRGFGAVAQEVRSLAERSAKAAMETAQLIEESGRKVSRGVTVAETTAGTLSSIVDNVNEVRSLVSEIATASKEQATGLNEVRAAMQQVNLASQSAMQQSAELAGASEQLSQLTKSLTGELSAFELSRDQSDGRASPPVGPRRSGQELAANESPKGLSKPVPRNVSKSQRYPDMPIDRPHAPRPMPSQRLRPEDTELAVDGLMPAESLAEDDDPAKILPLNEDERGYGTF